VSGTDIAPNPRVVLVGVAVQGIPFHQTSPEEGEAMMIHSIVRMLLPAAQLSEVTGILGPMVERTRAEIGCLSCHLYRDALEANVLLLEESWESEAGLKSRLRSQDYRQLLLIMELAKVPPEVRFDTVSNSTGIETIEQARG
jgi:quinol monooxygenase YgiN